MLGRAAADSRHRGPGYAFLHTALDDHSRLAYSEILTDERKETAAAFWTRAQAYFTSCGITVTRVLTDNGGCYRSIPFRDALGEVAHKRTRPYRPQTNGKVERFHRTQRECWRVAVESCGLPAGTRFHDLRHFQTSALIADGLHSKAIQARLGHATISETMDTYGHLFPDAEDQGRGALDRLIGGASRGPVVPRPAAR